MNNQPVGNIYLGRRYTLEEICKIQVEEYEYPKRKETCKGENHSYHYRFGGECESCKVTF